MFTGTFILVIHGYFQISKIADFTPNTPMDRTWQKLSKVENMHGENYHTLSKYTLNNPRQWDQAIFNEFRTRWPKVPILPLP